MVHRIALLVGSLILAVTCARVPWAAADASQSVRTESGKVRCNVNENGQSHGGLGPTSFARQIKQVGSRKPR